MALPPSAAKLYRTLLYAYPAEFRQEYGEEMEQLFTDRLLTESKFRVWAQALLDIAITAPTEHLHVVLADLKYAARIFAKSPAFTAVALLIIALGIGANTAVFSLMNAVLLRELPYGDAERLVYVWAPDPSLQLPAGLQLSFSNADYFDLRKEAKSFSNMAVFEAGVRNITGAGVTDRVNVARVTGTFFDTLQSRAQFGRAIDESDDREGHDKVAVISHVLWQSHFGGRTDVLGHVIRIEKTEYQIIGVMPPAFSYPHSDETKAYSDMPRTEVWVPFAMTQAQRANRDDSDGAFLARLKPGVTVRQAQAEMETMIARFDRLKGPMFARSRAEVQPFTDAALGRVRPLMWLMLGAVSLVLLIACSNVANLLMARAAERAHEMGVRSALGASRTRLIRQVLTEAILLASLGGLLGIGLAEAMIRVLLWINPSGVPRLEQTNIDGRVLVFCLLASLSAGVLFGLYPAFSLSMQSLTETLKRGGNKGLVGGSGRLRDVLIAAQISLAVILLAGAGLFIRSYQKLRSVDAGYSPSALTMSIALDDSYNQSQWNPFFESLLGQIRRVPGVELAGAISHLPLSQSESLGDFEVLGYQNEKFQLVQGRFVTPDYFQAIGTRLMAGRMFNNQDSAGKSHPAIVSEAFAKKYFGGKALGGRVQMGGLVHTVVGVVASVRHSSLEESPRPMLYLPFAEQSWRRAFLAVRTSSDPKRLEAQIRSLIRQIDPNLPVFDVQTMQERIDGDTAARRFQTVLLGAFAASALLLALVGLYGLITYSVRQRTAEIGIRMALGAERSDILRMVLSQGLRLALFGCLAGILGALALTRLLGSWLFEVSPYDPITFVLVPLILLTVALCACAIPAWRATETDPVTALRTVS